MRMTASKVGWPNSLLGSNVLVWCKQAVPILARSSLSPRQFCQGHTTLLEQPPRPSLQRAPYHGHFSHMIKTMWENISLFVVAKFQEICHIFISFINFRNISLQLWCLMRLLEVSRDQGAVFRPNAAFRCGGHNFLRTIWKESLSSSSFPSSQYHDFKPSS